MHWQFRTGSLECMKLTRRTLAPEAQQRGVPKSGALNQQRPGVAEGGVAAKASAALAGSEYTDLQALPGSAGAMACTGDGHLHLFGLQVG